MEKEYSLVIIVVLVIVALIWIYSENDVLNENFIPFVIDEELIESLNLDPTTLFKIKPQECESFEYGCKG